MKQLLLLGAGLLGLCTLGLTSAKAGSDDYYRRGDNDNYNRRPAYRERCDDNCDYHPRRRVVIVREYERPRYYEDDCRPSYHRRHRVNLYLPFPPLPF